MRTVDVTQKLNEFIKDNTNKSIEAEDSSNPWQCMDLIFSWCDKIGIPRETVRHLFAYQVWTQPLDITLKYFHYIPNTPNGIPTSGSIVVLNQGVGIAGHVDVSIGIGTSSYFQGFDQNWAGKRYARLVDHTYENVLGWLQPNTDDTAGTTEPLLAQIKDLQNRISSAKVALG